MSTPNEKEAKHHLRYANASAETAKDYVRDLDGNPESKRMANQEIEESRMHIEEAMGQLDGESMATGGMITKVKIKVPSKPEPIYATLKGYEGSRVITNEGEFDRKAVLKEFQVPEHAFMARGGNVKSNNMEHGGEVYHIFEGFDHYKQKPLYQVTSGPENENEYVGEWHTNRADAEKELADLNKNKSMAQGGKTGIRKLKEAIIEWQEGPTNRTVENKSYDNWEELEAQVFAVYEETDGGYNKTKIKFVWDDGTHKFLRIDVGPSDWKGGSLKEYFSSNKGMNYGSTRKQEDVDAGLYSWDFKGKSKKDLGGILIAGAVGTALGAGLGYGYRDSITKSKEEAIAATKKRTDAAKAKVEAQKQAFREKKERVKRGLIGSIERLEHGGKVGKGELVYVPHLNKSGVVMDTSKNLVRVKFVDGETESFEYSEVEIVNDDEEYSSGGSMATGGGVENGYTFKIQNVKDYNQTASPIMKFYHEGGDQDGELRKTGYVLSWEHEKGGTGAKFFKTMPEIEYARAILASRKYYAGGEMASRGKTSTSREKLEKEITTLEKSIGNDLTSDENREKMKIAVKKKKMDIADIDAREREEIQEKINQEGRDKVQKLLKKKSPNKSLYIDMDKSLKKKMRNALAHAGIPYESQTSGDTFRVYLSNQFQLDKAIALYNERREKAGLDPVDKEQVSQVIKKRVAARKVAPAVKSRSAKSKLSQKVEKKRSNAKDKLGDEE